MVSTDFLKTTGGCYFKKRDLFWFTKGLSGEIIRTSAQLFVCPDSLS